MINRAMKSVLRSPGGGASAVAGRLTVPALAILFLIGCSSPRSSLVENHTASDRKAEAHDRWTTIRSDVKLQLARRHLEAGRLGEAELAVREALAANRENREALLLTARIRLAQGQLAEAKAAIEEALNSGEQSGEAHYLAGLVAQRYEDLPTALVHYQAAAETEQNESEYVLAVAETMVALDRPLDALELVESRVSDFDGVASVRLAAARLNQMLGLRQPAAEHARAGLQLVDGKPAAQVDLGMILIWAGAHVEGIDAIRPVVESKLGSLDSLKGVEPDSTGVVTTGVLTGLAEAYSARGDWREVRRVLKPVLRHDDQSTPAWCLYARASIEVGSIEDAASALDHVLMYNPDTLEPLLLRAYLALESGDASRAMSLAKRAVAIDENCLSGQWLLAESAERAGAQLEAKRARAMILSLAPDSDLARVVVARMSDPGTTHRPSKSIVGTSSETAGPEPTWEAVDVP